jgi:uncharacterized protein YjbJ (UPF0337 family)
MAGTIQRARGRMKQVVGNVSGNRRMKTEGTFERTAGNAKAKVRRAQNSVEGTVNRARRKH